jgi:hypothetical protein
MLYDIKQWEMVRIILIIEHLEHCNEVKIF